MNTKEIGHLPLLAPLPIDTLLDATNGEYKIPTGLVQIEPMGIHISTVAKQKEMVYMPRKYGQRKKETFCENEFSSPEYTRRHCLGGIDTLQFIKIKTFHFGRTYLQSAIGACGRCGRGFFADDHSGSLLSHKEK
ncbi:MAG: hypothetical protein RRY06_08505 [Lachnospiraceae bacterium]